MEATKADSTVVSCIANANGASICRGEMLNLNKLTCYLDLITRKVVRDDGSSAMERAIIKSRLKIPFWSADDVRPLQFVLLCGLFLVLIFFVNPFRLLCLFVVHIVRRLCKLWTSIVVHYVIEDALQRRRDKWPCTP